MTYSIKVQMLEVYNDSLHDLLAAPSCDASPPPEALKILSTLASGCNVQGARQVGWESDIQPNPHHLLRP